MTKAIQQSVRFKATPAELFEMYLDSKQHSAATGGKATMSRKAGGAFTAWNKQIWGTNLQIVPNRLIVQAWRSVNLKPGDADSILVLKFSKTPGGARVDLVHVNVPQQDRQGVSKGWPTYYWRPWKKYLAAKREKR
ncbi:MAG TPA: SRPBCC domain-containing protein [Verrucomicrobiae bacterium]|nr:SRPBCC domain-containing protein [Verrucomicrobiae bacterium]